MSEIHYCCHVFDSQSSFFIDKKNMQSRLHAINCVSSQKKRMSKVNLFTRKCWICNQKVKKNPSMFQGISKQTLDNYYAGVFLLLSPLNTTNCVDKSCRALDSLKKPLYHLFHFFPRPWYYKYNNGEKNTLLFTSFTRSTAVCLPTLNAFPQNI